MKKIICSVAIAATIFVACNSGNNKTTNTKSTTATNTIAFPVQQIIADYLQLKNALATDNSKDAAAAGDSMITTFSKIENVTLPENQQKVYTGLRDHIEENAKKIAANADKIESQREHFEMLSKYIADLVTTFGNGGKTLYKDFCPMANDGKGAIWISEVKEIKNPYWGSKMPKCGSVKETLN